jgi:L-ascorbate metabolism protein UlaG (beta-lactamase superfamily)
MITAAAQTGILRLRRLAWAGVEVSLGGTHVLIDPLQHAASLSGLLGAPRRPLAPIEAPPGAHALVTHTHSDHCDRALLAGLAVEGTVGCHLPVARALADAGVEAIGQELGTPRRIGPLTVTPVPSLDWRGDDQVAWVVEGAGQRIIHCGDTIWHGSWWQIARDHGPFAVAFLPINGVMVRLEGFTPARVPATLTPEQAIEAAVVLGASSACAIHFGLFHNPPTYVEQPDVEQRFRRAADERGVTAALPDLGRWFPVTMGPWPPST